MCYKGKAKLIEPGSTLTVVSMLSMTAISTTTSSMAAIFMSTATTSSTVVHRYKKKETTAGYKQQKTDYHKSDFFHNSILFLPLLLSGRFNFLTTDAEVFAAVPD
jgi:hypothetical protein